MSEHFAGVGDSSEHIAFRLLEMIIAKDPPKPPLSMNATWVLTTYARCLRTVRSPDVQPKPEPVKPRPSGAA
jgi:hypothetical protein